MHGNCFENELQTFMMLLINSISLPSTHTARSMNAVLTTSSQSTENKISRVHCLQKLQTVKKFSYNWFKRVMTL